MTTGAIIALFGCIYISSVFCNYFLVRENFKRDTGPSWTLRDRWICIGISCLSLIVTLMMLWDLLIMNIGKMGPIDWDKEVKW